MKAEYVKLYNKLIKLTSNKFLYNSLNKPDTFSDRLTLFLLHFAFFLKVFKTLENEKLLQKIYDFNFRQLELNIREIGYGDQTVNKRMKDYINLFHSILSDVHYWDFNKNENNYQCLTRFLHNFENIDFLVQYFNDYCKNLKNMICIHI
jgi:cytochrome b pre-mRNA-processing protein 3